ncbi:MAG: hypothetical protein EOM80_06375 [Erysipelotrichia bacterium]|nr:hypothetical protein [Erysipelotrichia bacterium]
MPKKTTRIDKVMVSEPVPAERGGVQSAGSASPASFAPFKYMTLGMSIRSEASEMSVPSMVKAILMPVEAMQAAADAL